MEAGQSLILGADIGIELVNVVEIEAALRPFGQVLIFRECGIQRLQNAPIVDEQTILLLLMQPVHTSNGLDQIVLFELLVDVEDSVARLIKSGEQLVDHNQDVGSALRREILDDLALVVLGVAFDVLLPPLQHLGKLCLIDLRMSLAGIWGRNDDGAADQTGRIQGLLVADG